MNTGRPTIYSKDLADDICLRISAGESVRNIVKDPTMPASTTIFRWLFDDNNKGFREQYTLARNIQAELTFEELQEIADEADNVIQGDDKSDGARVQAKKLRVDTRKWAISKMLPKKYGDKLDVTSGGERLPTPILGNALPANDSYKQDSESHQED